MGFIRTKQCRRCGRSAELTPAHIVVRVEGDERDNIRRATYVYWCPYPDCGSFEEHALSRRDVLLLRAMGVRVVRRDDPTLPEQYLTEDEVIATGRRIKAAPARDIFAELESDDDDAFDEDDEDEEDDDDEDDEDDA